MNYQLPITNNQQPIFNMLLLRSCIRRNTVPLAAPLRFLPTIGSKFTQLVNSSLLLLRQHELSSGAFLLAKWVPKMLEVAVREKIIPDVFFMPGYSCYPCLDNKGIYYA